MRGLAGASARLRALLAQGSRRSLSETARQVGYSQPERVKNTPGNRSYLGSNRRVATSSSKFVTIDEPHVMMNDGSRLQVM
jgi:hypothetical protein